MSPVPLTLGAAAAAVMVNVWLGSRISMLRAKLKVSVGDGGQEALLRRMRAQANYIEHAPFFLILFGALELSGANRWALAALAVIFFLGRIAHGFGMDGGSLQHWRRDGLISSMVALLLLAIWATVCAAQLCLGR
jgi:uncharacterized membrane protein YecN with MAPEG domain